MFYSLKRKLTVLYYRLRPRRRYTPMKPTTVSLGDIIRINDEQHYVHSVGSYPETGDDDVKFYIGTDNLGGE